MKGTKSIDRCAVSMIAQRDPCGIVLALCGSHPAGAKAPGWGSDGNDRAHAGQEARGGKVAMQD
jgi:hypothetical protein